MADKVEAAVLRVVRADPGIHGLALIHTVAERFDVPHVFVSRALAHLYARKRVEVDGDHAVWPGDA